MSLTLFVVVVFACQLSFTVSIGPLSKVYITGNHFTHKYKLCFAVFQYTNLFSDFRPYVIHHGVTYALKHYYFFS